jgi:hypothetical protein
MTLFVLKQKLRVGIQMENKFISNQIIINMDSSNVFFNGNDTVSY